MQRTLTALLLFLFTLPAWGQAIPGTFNRMPPRRDIDLYSVPVITTPQISFGSGLTPPVVALGQELVVSTPTGTYPPSLITQPWEANQENREPGRWPRAYTHPEHVRFDYVVAPTEGPSPAQSETESLGAAADSMRKGPPPAQHTYTNQDIDRLNNSNQNFSTPSAKPQEQPVQPPSNEQPQKQQLQDNQRSPFATQLTASVEE